MGHFSFQSPHGLTMGAIANPTVGLLLDDGKENLMSGKQENTLKENEEKQMPEGFAPSEFDVLVGWARQNFHHAGNCMFRDLITNNVQRYIQADSKTSRGEIISDILRQIQSKSPSHTGFLKLDPESARWVSIGSNKAKDKVGHALRKAVMSIQGGNGDENQRSASTKPVVRDSSHQEASPPTKSNKRKASEPVSILKRGREAKYESSTLGVDTTALAGPSPDERTPLTRFFSSLGAPPTILRSPMEPAGSPSFGLSPVARNIFDDKDDALSPLYSRRSRRGNTSSGSSFFGADMGHVHQSNGGSLSSSCKDDHGATELHGYVKQPQAPADYPNAVPIHASLPAFLPPGAYFPLGPSNVWSHPPQPPVHHPVTAPAGGAPPDVPTAMFPPPPPQASAVPYYYPPGFYYYPGYGMPLAPPTAVPSSQAPPPPSFPFLPRTDGSSVTYQQDVSFPSHHFSTQAIPPYDDSSSNKHLSVPSYVTQQDVREQDDDPKADREQEQV